MKLSKTTLVFLGVGIFAILAAGLGLTYSQRSREQNQLEQELSLAQLRLTKYSSPEELLSRQNELESQLAELGVQFEDAKGRLRQPVESIEVTDTLFEVAEACDVEIVELSSPGLASDSRNLRGITCSVLSLRAKAEGTVHDLISFIFMLSKKFPTGVFQSVGISIPEVIVEETGGGEEVGEEEGVAEEEETGGEEEAVGEEETGGEEEAGGEGGEISKPTVNFELLIHTYEGD